MYMTLHFETLKLKSHVLDQTCNLSMLFCTLLTSLLELIVVSSASISALDYVHSLGGHSHSVLLQLFQLALLKFLLDGPRSQKVTCTAVSEE